MARSVAKALQQMRDVPTDVRFADLKRVCDYFFGSARQAGTSHRATKSRETCAAVNVDHYTYRVTWSSEDGEHVGLCAELPSLSWLAPTPHEALSGIRKLAADAVADMRVNAEAAPPPLAERAYSGQFKVRIPPELHRSLVMQAAEQGVSLNRLASAKLASG